MLFFSPLVPAALLLLCFTGSVAAAEGAAVIDDGYAGRVLQKILPHVRVGSGQHSEARISLDGEGKYLRCANVKGNAQSICQAAKSVGSFGDPPYGVPTDVLVAIYSDIQAVKNQEKNAAPKELPQSATQTQNKSHAAWLSRVRHALRDSIYIPKETKPGKYQATVSIKCDAKGKVLERAIAKSSGDARLDRYVLQGIDRAGSVEAPPQGAGNNFNVDFTLVR